MLISLHALLGVSLVALGMVLTPGPNMVHLVSRSAVQGRRAGLVSLGGVAVGFLAYLCAANLGLSALLTQVPTLYTAVKLAGAAYLALLAWQAVRPGAGGGLPDLTAQGAADRATAQPHSALRLFGAGLLTNLLNPKIAVMYLSLLPPFVDPAAGHVLAQGFLLGGVQIAVSLGVNLLLVLAAGSIAGFLGHRPGWLRVQRRTTGAVLGLLAVRMAAEHAPHTPHTPPASHALHTPQALRAGGGGWRTPVS